MDGCLDICFRWSVLGATTTTLQHAGWGGYVDIVAEWPRVGLFDVRAIWCTFLAALRRRVSFSMPRSPADPCDDLVAHAESDHTPTRAGYKNILSSFVSCRCL